MKRRDVLAAVASTAMIWPLPLAAQQRVQRPRVGVLAYGTPDRDPSIQSFLKSMRELGYTEGQNITYEFRAAEGKPERLPDLAAELVRLKPNVLFSSGGDVTSWIAKATQAIPIVYSSSADPVKIGLAASLAKPGGNATGVTLLSDELAAKRIQLFKAAVPRLSRVGFLRDPSHADNEEPVAQHAAKTLGIELHLVPLHGSADLDRAMTAATGAKIDGLYVVSSRHVALNIRRIVDFATKNRLPLIGGWGAWVELGGLMSYGPNTADMLRQSAVYVDRVLKGAKTSDLPVQQPTRFELHINLKTAKEFGLAIPETFILLADRIIE